MAFNLQHSNSWKKQNIKKLLVQSNLANSFTGLSLGARGGTS